MSNSTEKSLQIACPGNVQLIQWRIVQKELEQHLYKDNIQNEA